MHGSLQWLVSGLAHLTRLVDRFGGMLARPTSRDLDVVSQPFDLRTYLFIIFTFWNFELVGSACGRQRVEYGAKSNKPPNSHGSNNSDCPRTYYLGTPALLATAELMALDCIIGKRKKTY